MGIDKNCEMVYYIQLKLCNLRNIVQEIACNDAYNERYCIDIAYNERLHSSGECILCEFSQGDVNDANIF